MAQEIQRLGDSVKWPNEHLGFEEQPDSNNGQHSIVIPQGESLNHSGRLLRGQTQNHVNEVKMRALAKRTRAPRMIHGRKGSGKGKGGGSRPSSKGDGSGSKGDASKGKGGNSMKGMGKGGSSSGMGSKGMGMGKGGPMGMGKGMGILDPSPVQSPADSPVVSPTVPTLRPSKAAATLSPSKAATTQNPSKTATTQNPSKAATTQNPSKTAATQSPSEAATTQSPSKTAATDRPSVSTDTTERPTQGNAPPEQPPTDSPSKGPSDEGTTETPSAGDVTTEKPSDKGTTKKPSAGEVTTETPSDGGTTETPSAGDVITETPSVGAGSVSLAPSYTPGTRCFPSDSDIVPCPDPQLAAICDKYNPIALFSKCYADCVDAFCCIHDSAATRSPSCSKDVNCQFFKPCYIVWFKLHDTIGPAPFLRLKQNEAFYDINDDDFQKVIQDNTAFYNQFLGHHFLTDDLPLTDATFIDPANW